ncbi:MAG: 50S ribosome-binding GTPase [Candidatus Nanopusillus sp.]|nr:50S ribosome-binding GTPase [Candidatus Nanopusillus sp.]MCG2883196.1 50S ribosome-binding GTPase [Candidatus Nanopusillus sp.]
MKYKFVEELLSSAFKRAKNNGNQFYDIKERNIVKLQTIYQYIDDKLEKIYNDIILPENKFYKELYKLLFTDINIKKLKERIKYIRKIIRQVYLKYNNDIKLTKDKKLIEKYRREFYGRISSILRRNWIIFKYYNIYLNRRRKIPNIKNLPTVVISGLPNVGKSTLLKNLTGSNVKIEPYPFTTKDLMIGYIKTPYFDIQVIDTPGILDRPIEEMNEIEKKSILALNYLANLIIYIFDLTETCGYSIEEQENLLNNIKKIFNKEIILYFSKKDLFTEREEKILNEFIKKYNNMNIFYDYNKLKEFLISYIKNKKEWYI